MKKAGWVLTVFLSVFLLAASAAPKLLGLQVALEPMTKLGWPTKYLLLIGIIEVVGTVLFVIPKTALAGAVLLTGLFGGAIASNLRVDNPLFTHTLFGLYLGALMWLALWLRDGSLRALFHFSGKSGTQ